MAEHADARRGRLDARRTSASRGVRNLAALPTASRTALARPRDTTHATTHLRDVRSGRRPDPRWGRTAGTQQRQADRQRFSEPQGGQPSRRISDGRGWFRTTDLSRVKFVCTNDQRRRRSGRQDSLQRIANDDLTEKSGFDHATIGQTREWRFSREGTLPALIAVCPVASSATARGTLARRRSRQRDFQKCSGPHPGQCALA
jgi:hypothetical protein